MTAGRPRVAASLAASVLAACCGAGAAPEGGRAPLAAPPRRALVANVRLGTPPQELRCLMDTGSSDLWVPSGSCSSCLNERFFTVDESSTVAPELTLTEFGPRPRTVTLTYGTGQIVGFVVQDTVSLGGLNIRNQSFLVVEDARLPARSWDGICGLGWDGLAKTGLPFYARLAELGAAAMFAFVPTARNESYMRAGEVPYSDIKPDTLVWVDAEVFEPGGGPGAEGGGPGPQRTFWVVSGGLAVRQEAPTSVRFLVDTGTSTVLLAPPAGYPVFVQSLISDSVFHDKCGVDTSGGIDLVVCECSVAEDPSLPSVRVFLAGRPVVVEARTLFARVPAGGSEQDLCVLQVQPNPMASGPLQGLLGDRGGGAGASEAGGGSAARRAGAAGGGGGVQDAMEDVWVLGALFLERVVVVFDFDAARAGFAEPASPPPPLSALAALPLLGEAESGGARAARPARPGAPAAAEWAPREGGAPRGAGPLVGAGAAAAAALLVARRRGGARAAALGAAAAAGTDPRE